MGAVPWIAPAWVAGGLCPPVWSLLSARAKVVTVAALPVVVGIDTSQSGWPPKVTFFVSGSASVKHVVKLYV